MASTTIRARRVAEARVRPAITARIRATDELRRYIKVLDDNRIAATENATLFEVGNRFVILNGRIQQPEINIALPFDSTDQTNPDGSVVMFICKCDVSDANDDDCVWDLVGENLHQCNGTCGCYVMEGKINADGSYKPPYKVTNPK